MNSVQVNKKKALEDEKLKSMNPSENSTPQSKTREGKSARIEIKNHQISVTFGEEEKCYRPSKVKLKDKRLRIMKVKEN